MGQTAPRRQILLVPLLVVLLLGLGGCRADLSDGASPKLISISKELLAKKTKANVTKRKRFESDQGDPFSLVSNQQIEGYISDCQVEQTGSPQKADLTGTYDLVWKGEGASLLGTEAPPTNEFNWIEGDSEFMDPNRISESAGHALASQMFEPLMTYAPDNGPARYGAAKSHEVSPDGKTYTFHLREGLVWSDGKKITAHDFRTSWLRGLSPEIGSRNAQQIWNFVKGAKAYNRGETTDTSTVAITVPDDLTLKVELNYPTPFFTHLVSYIAYAPVPMHVIKKYGDRWTRPENIVVNGPYKMVEWRPRARMVFEINERYWDADNVQIKKHTAYLTASEEANVTYYLNGQVHTAQPLPEDKVRNWIKEGLADLQVAEQMGVYYYVFRVDRPPFNNRLVRKAFNMALDKERLTSHVLSGFKPPAQNLLPDMYGGTLGYIPSKGDAFDPVGARALLAGAGYPGGKSLGNVELIYNTYEAHKKIAEFYQQSIMENLGVSMTVNNMEWKSLLKRCFSGDFQLARTSWIADYPDPLTFLEVWHSDSANNYAGYKNFAYDGLLGRIKETTDPAERNDLICAAEKVINTDLPVSPLYFYTRPYLIHPSVGGFLPQYADHHLIKYVYYKR